MNHKLTFEESKRQALDANVAELNRYELFDPRNPLTKRRREQSKQQMKEGKKQATWPMHNCVYVMDCRAAFAATVSALSEDTYMYSAFVQCMWLVTEVDTSEATRLNLLCCAKLDTADRGATICWQQWLQNIMQWV